VNVKPTSLFVVPWVVNLMRCLTSMRGSYPVTDVCTYAIRNSLTQKSYEYFAISLAKQLDN